MQTTVRVVGAKVKNGTVVKFCTCASAFQDKTYGLHMRVHNLAKSGAKCTVCGKGN